MTSRTSSRSCALLFDMDETLVRTRPLVERAYREAGVEMPPHAWGKPAAEWLVDLCGGDVELAAKTHAEKNKIYMKLLERTPPAELPAAQVLRESLSDPRFNVCVATSASYEAAYAVMQRQLGLFVPMRCRLTVDALVRFVLSFDGPRVLVNDSAETLRVFERDFPWVGRVHAAPAKSAEVLALEVRAEAVRSESLTCQKS